MIDYPKFRDISALEVLRSGESEAMERLLEAAVFMEGFARGADMRFAAIEARLTALEKRTVSVEVRTGGGGGSWNPDTAPVHHVSEELRQKLARDANEAVSGRTGVGGVVSPAAGEADIEQLPQDRDAEGRAVETGGEVPLSASGRKVIARDDG
jgi:hypothetical protein